MNPAEPAKEHLWDTERKAFYTEAEAVVISGAAAALLEAGILEIHKALL